MSRRKTLVLATHNIYKRKEMNRLLAELDVNIVGLDHFPDIGDIKETGTTLIENAFLKARTVHNFTGLPSLADDTGLEVDALNGAPGVYSARFAGESATFKDNVKKLLTELGEIPLEKRTAHFRTIISFVDGNTELWTEGVIKGNITKRSTGKEGFGYDPVFVPEHENRTFAEMTSVEKNKVSHRAQGLEKMKKSLKTYFDKGDIIE
ncbi:MAG: non-canonical purine NTP pyrophosphatase, RdgB/HAM1 family [Candidatus Marinimicrobia bacterium]|nr:non-canonical purine NTP pyrophosphatase, RdgB/HAM1 family [Candidatus Neomarinimicrobiota bacterium]